MKLDRLTLLVALVALGLVAFQFFGVQKSSRVPPSQSSAPATAYVILEDTGGTCHVTSKTDRIYAGRGQVVQWEIDNRCATDQTVRLADFTSGDPLDNPPHDRMVPAHDARTLTRRVKFVVQMGTYPYSIYLGNIKQTDPDIVIEF